ncbi:MAG TPA: hypothetical protein VII25_09920 [Candidatus Acidoferrum sp.]
MNSPKASASIIAAGILAILGSLLAMLSMAVALMGLYLTPAQRDVPAFASSAAAVMFGFLFFVALFGVFTGIGLLRLKNWARISALIWAGVTVFFSSLGVMTILLIPFPAVPTAPNVNMAAVKAFVAAFYALPILIGIWWLILFNKAAIKAQFTGTTPVASTDTPTRPRCPLPVAIIAGFMLFSVLGLFAMPLMHMPIAMILFGHRIHGEFGSFLFASTTVLYLAAAIGLLRLQRWSYPLSLGLYAFWTLSGVTTFFSPNYPQLMKEIFSEMNLPESSTAGLQLVNSRGFALLTLIPTLIIVAILLYYRKRFWEASAAAQSAV